MSEKYSDELDRKIVETVGWRYIFQSLTSSLDEAFANEGFHVTCPFPKDHSPESSLKKFRIARGSGYDFDVDGSVICTCNNNRQRKKFGLLLDLGVGSDFSDVLRRVRSLVEKGVSSKTSSETRVKGTVRNVINDINSDAKVAMRRNNLRGVATKLLNLNDSSSYPAQRYLQGRGLSTPLFSTCVKYHPDLDYYTSVDGVSTKVGASPAIVSVLSDAEGLPKSLHRIYIDKHGCKSEFGSDLPVKLVMGSAVNGDLPGCSIKIFTESNSRSLNITEGLEVGLSLLPILKESTWAAYSSTSMGTLVVPRNSFDLVRIWADYDPITIDEDRIKGGAGMRDAIKLEKRLLSEGFRVQLCIPSKEIHGDKKVDWENIVTSDSVKSSPTIFNELVNNVASKEEVDNYRTIFKEFLNRVA
jgi:hypothetical protein